MGYCDAVRVVAGGGSSHRHSDESKEQCLVGWGLGSGMAWRGTRSGLLEQSDVHHTERYKHLCPRSDIRRVSRLHRRSMAVELTTCSEQVVYKHTCPDLIRGGACSTSLVHQG